MTKLEQGWFARYLAAFTLHGYRGVQLHRVAKLTLRSVNAGACAVTPGNQTRSTKWKQGPLSDAHGRAIESVRRQARKRDRRKGR